MCDVLDVSTSGYYDWCDRPPSARQQANDKLLEAIREEYKASRQTYGSPRIQAALKRKGWQVGKNRIARLMRKNGIVGKAPERKFPRTTQRAERALAAPNILSQQFTASRPNAIWLADITYVDTYEGWLYLALIMDLFARPVVGWAMAAHMRATLVVDALQMALDQRQPAAGLLFHSDQGSQFTSQPVQSLLAAHQVQVSMSGVGNCYDNAPMESLIGTVKTECITERFPTRRFAHHTIFEYLEVWYNRQRLHSALGYLAPLEFENHHFYPFQSVR